MLNIRHVAKRKDYASELCKVKEKEQRIFIAQGLPYFNRRQSNHH
jgi:hypothetical protein